MDRVTEPDHAVVATYELEGAFKLEDAARVVAMEQTTGTWTPVPKRSGSQEKRLAGWVVDVDEQRHRARIAFPTEIFEPHNLPGMLAILAGNLFGLGSLRRARWIDVSFPHSLARKFPGPALGVKGIRHVLGTHDSQRPHGGTIVKPKVGLNPRATAEVAGQAALGGIDFIKDDETLTDQTFCPMEERTHLVMSALDDAREEVGKTCLYAVNVTTAGADILDRWDRARDAGADCVMIDVLTAGFDALLTLREACDVPIHVHRAMHGALTRAHDFGISMQVICRLVRLCGGDQLHVGSATGKMEHPEDLLQLLQALRGQWHGMQPVFPVASGGLHPASVPGEVAVFGSDVLIQAGGGIHGHPDGTRAGAAAMMQAIEAAHADRPLEREPYPELQAALRRWSDESYAYTPTTQ